MATDSKEATPPSPPELHQEVVPTATEGVFTAAMARPCGVTVADDGAAFAARLASSSFGVSDFTTLGLADPPGDVEAQVQRYADAVVLVELALPDGSASATASGLLVQLSAEAAGRYHIFDGVLTEQVRPPASRSFASLVPLTESSLLLFPFRFVALRAHQPPRRRVPAWALIRLNLHARRRGPGVCAAGLHRWPEASPAQRSRRGRLSLPAPLLQAGLR